MTFKVYYQPDATKRPVRENTQSLYIEADSEAQALLLVEENTDYKMKSQNIFVRSVAYLMINNLGTEPNCFLSKNPNYISRINLHRTLFYQLSYCFIKLRFSHR